MEEQIKKIKEAIMILTHVVSMNEARDQRQELKDRGITSFPSGDFESRIDVLMRVIEDAMK